MTKTLRPLALLAAVFTGTAAMAQDLEVIGRPTPGGTGFQPAATDISQATFALDNLLHIISILIAGFVALLIIWVIVRYNKGANKTPGTFTHNTGVEIAWTLIPIVILVFIGAQSLPVLFKQQEIPEGDVVIKVTGYQWYWGYEYVDHDFAFDSYMIGSPATGGENRKTDEVVAQLEEAGYSEDEWLLATDTAVVVPVNKTVVIQVTGGDVIHSWTIPAFGVKQDGVPGRLAQLWFKAEQEGVYFGQCSELCGQAHAYMPITVKVVSEEEYEQWLEGAIEEYAGTPQSYDVASR